MPIRSDVDAEALGARTTATATSIAASAAPPLRTCRVPPERRQRTAQAFVERDLGLPAEELPRARDVGLPHLRVVDRQGLEHDLARRPGGREDSLGQLEDGVLAGVADVDRQVLAGLGEQDQAPDQVVDVAEAPRLRAVAVDGERLLGERLAQEVRDRAAVV